MAPEPEPEPEPEPARSELEPALAVRRIELSWVQLQRRRAREVDGAAEHIQRIYRGHRGRRRGSAPGAAPSDPVLSGGGEEREEDARRGAAARSLAPGGSSLDGKTKMTAGSYHKQKMRATRQRPDGWRPPGACVSRWISR